MSPLQHLFLYHFLQNFNYVQECTLNQCAFWSTIYFRRSVWDGCGDLLTVDFGGGDYWILLYLLMLIIRVQTFRFHIGSFLIRRSAKVPGMVNKTTDIQQASIGVQSLHAAAKWGMQHLDKLDDWRSFRGRRRGRCKFSRIMDFNGIVGCFFKVIHVQSFRSQKVGFWSICTQRCLKCEQITGLASNNSASEEFILPCM